MAGKIWEFFGYRSDDHSLAAVAAATLLVETQNVFANYANKDSKTQQHPCCWLKRGRPRPECPLLWVQRSSIRAAG
ncbi:MAG: hypothetical protein COS34_07410 [Lysobacterales bacterium CG02_land_8_20_14_3_00_62_12]|nr:MAG: hypothetical protein COS34_07410 [Xanthomonadales bacterium CG02_land_8_20_14_3_00_62_12]